MFHVKQAIGQAFLILVLGMSAHGAYFDTDAFYGGNTRAAGFVASGSVTADEEGFDTEDWDRVPVAVTEPTTNSQFLSALDGGLDIAMAMADQNAFFLAPNLPILNEGDVQSVFEGGRQNSLPQMAPQVLDMNAFNRAMGGLYAEMGMDLPDDEDELLDRESHLSLTEQSHQFEQEMEFLERSLAAQRFPKALTEQSHQFEQEIEFLERSLAGQRSEKVPAPQAAAAAAAVPAAQAATPRRVTVRNLERRRLANRQSAKGYRSRVKNAREWVLEAVECDPEVRQAYERILQEGQQKANQIKAQAKRKIQRRKEDKAAGMPVEDAKEFKRALNVLHSRVHRARRQDKAIEELYVEFHKGN